MSLSLIECIKDEEIEEVRRCIQQGADVNTKDNGNGFSALMWASFIGNTEIFKLLLENGAYVEPKRKGDYPPLVWAAQFNRTEIVKLLLENDADINFESSGGMTALRWAAFDGITELVELLLENGAKITNDLLGNDDIKEKTEVLKMLKDEIERRKHLKMARYTFLRHTNFHLAQEIAVRMK